MRVDLYDLYTSELISTWITVLKTDKPGQRAGEMTHTDTEVMSEHAFYLSLWADVTQGVMLEHKSKTQHFMLVSVQTNTHKLPTTTIQIIQVNSSNNNYSQ